MIFTESARPDSGRKRPRCADRADAPGPVFLDPGIPKDLMTSMAVKLLVLLFAGLVIACPYEASGAPHLPTTSSPEGGTFCGILHSSIAGTVRLEQPASLLPSKEPAAAIPKRYLPWSLVQRIDHPPEVSA